MPGVREAFERGDRAAFGALLDPAVVWIGVHAGREAALAAAEAVG